MATEKQLNLIRELMQEMEMSEGEALNYSPTDKDSIEDLSVGDAAVVIEALIDEKDMRKF